MNAIVENSNLAIVFGPVKFDSEKFNDVLSRFGGVPNLTNNEPIGVSECGAFAVYPTREIIEAPERSWLYSSSAGLWRVESDAVVRDHVYTLLNDEDAREKAKELLAGIRWEVETGGIKLGEMHIGTDRDIRASITEAYATLKDGLIQSTDWKRQDGWMTVNLEQIRAIATAVTVHVKNVFGAERVVSEKIDTLTAEQLVDFDLNAEYERAFSEFER